MRAMLLLRQGRDEDKKFRPGQFEFNTIFDVQSRRDE